jgi:outer membrane protein assembly factor BamB
MKARAAVALLSLALVGCQTVGGYYDRMFGASKPAVKPAELPPIKAGVVARVAWQLNVGGSGKFSFTPIAVQDSVYAANAAGELVKIDAASGKAQWRVQTQLSLSSGPGSDGRVVVVGSPRGEVAAFDAAGKGIWKAQISGEVLSAPALNEDVVAVRSGDGRIFGLAIQDGKRRWLYQRALPALTVRAPSGLTVVAGGVFSGFAGGKLVAVLLKNGALAWEATVSSPRGATELERMADIVGAPLVEGRVVCAAAYQGRTGCFDAVKGSQLWVRDLSSLTSLAADSRSLYVTDDKGGVQALAKLNGASLWRQDRLAGRGVTGPTPFRGYVAVADYQGYVHFLEANDGSVATRVATDGSAVLHAPVVAGNLLLVQTRNGALFALGPP